MKHRLWMTCMTAVLISPTLSPAADPVKVFILAGQSNMEGKARVKLLDSQAGSDRFAADYAHLRKDDAWIERDDVWIKFLNRHGKLTVGYGSPKCIGPELQFGWTVGDKLDQQVLLIKTAWGGKSLARDFRPPSSGMPDEEVLSELLERRQKKKPEATMDEIRDSFGFYYRAMLAEVESTLENLKTLFPDYDEQGYEIAGIVWFQGWNDMVNESYTAEYAENMANFIRDVRKDLKRPNLPFVIGQLGVGGANEQPPNRKKATFKLAQAQPATLPEFAGNVAVVQTDKLWDMEADKVFRQGWKENLEAWNQVGSDRPYHYLGSGRCHLRMGQKFAEAVLNPGEFKYKAPAVSAEAEDVNKESQPAVKTSFYEPNQRNIEGWTVRVDPEMERPENKEQSDLAFVALANHLQRIKFIVSEDRLAKLQELPIWIERKNERLKSMQYHPSRQWLVRNGHDPKLARHVHIPNAADLVNPRTWAKHPYVVLHELAHAYHDQVLDFDNKKIKSVYDAAKAEGIYEKVLLFTGQKVKHYGLNNEKEYFAESTEAYFGVNDFYPFVRAELKEHDPRMFQLLEDVWGKIR